MLTEAMATNSGGLEVTATRPHGPGRQSSVEKAPVLSLGFKGTGVGT